MYRIQIPGARILVLYILTGDYSVCRREEEEEGMIDQRSSCKRVIKSEAWAVNVQSEIVFWQR